MMILLDELSDEPPSSPLLLLLLIENPDNDPHRGGETKDPGGSAGQP